MGAVSLHFGDVVCQGRVDIIHSSCVFLGGNKNHRQISARFCEPGKNLPGGTDHENAGPSTYYQALSGM